MFSIKAPTALGKNVLFHTPASIVIIRIHSLIVENPSLNFFVPPPEKATSTNGHPPVSQDPEISSRDQLNNGVVTPIDPIKLCENLVGYDNSEISFLCTGFSKGFDLGFKGQTNNSCKVQNLKSCSKNPEAVEEYLAKEVDSGRIIGPFNTVPFKKFQLSPIGLVPKKTPGLFRVIVDLSYPQGESINDGIPDEAAHISYSTVSDAIKLILACGKHAYLAKADIEKAFRIIPLRPTHHSQLGMFWNNQFFFDRCLPMGARSACQIFERFSCGLEFAVAKKGVQLLTHYLDDFLFINRSKSECHDDLKKFISVCSDINVPLAHDKTVGPTQVLNFLGLEIDTVAEQVRLPFAKLTACTAAITDLLEKSKCTLRELQSLLGLLSFACQVIIPGRAFLQRLYALTARVSKPYYSIRLTKDTKKDLELWLTFLSQHNGVSLYRDELFLSPEVHHLYTDASKSLACSGVFGNHWFVVPWPSDWWKSQNITFLELVPIVLAVECWAHLLRNTCVELHTDNMDLTFIINKQTSKEELVMVLVRKLILALLKNNIMCRALHIPGVKNSLADFLSRLQVSRFKESHPSADPFPTKTVDLSTLLS